MIFIKCKALLVQPQIQSDIEQQSGQNAALHFCLLYACILQLLFYVVIFVLLEILTFRMSFSSLVLYRSAGWILLCVQGVCHSPPCVHNWTHGQHVTTLQLARNGREGSWKDLGRLLNG